MNIYSRIREACKTRRFQLGEVEKKAGLGFKTIYNWKESAPSADKLQKVANILNTTMEYLMGETDDIDAKIGAASNAAGMTVEEKELLSLFRSVSVEGKAAIMTAARAFAGQVDYTKKAASESGKAI